MKKTGKRLLAAMLLFCTILIGAAGYEVMAADEAQSTESTSGTVNSADDLPGKRIGVQLGTTRERWLRHRGGALQQRCGCDPGIKTGKD